VYNGSPAVHEFLWQLYDMSGEDYYKLCLKIDKISQIKWWNKILLAQEERLSSCYKEKRANQKRAERAELAVKEVIQSFLNKNNHPTSAPTSTEDTLQLREGLGTKRLKIF
jgi:hypothetical protein